MHAGLVQLPIWGYILVALGFTHITIAAVTIYLHRNQAHRAVELHPLVAHFFRAWLWFTTGMQTKQWTAIHRKHHAFVETKADPHSPQVHGINKVLWEGAELYREESKNLQTMEDYGHGTPNDWLERNLYSRHTWLGIWLMLSINLLLFGFLGLTIWAVQMAWVPFFAAGIINGVGHWGGYRNYEVADASRNIIPWGILIGGEELHNNHHAFASSAKFSSKWFEFDAGWLYIRLLSLVGLARVKKLAPIPYRHPEKFSIDVDTLKAVIANRLYVMSDYAKQVVTQVHKEEIRKAPAPSRDILKPTKRWLRIETSRLDEEARQRLEHALSYSNALKEVYRFKLKLQAIWNEKTATQESLLDALQEWCHQAEATGIQALEDFARSLRAYSLQPT